MRCTTRYCPICEQEVTADVCPTDGVPTVSVAVLDGRRSLLRRRSTLAPGLRINNRYELVRKIGEGGMGSVFVAHQLGVDREVAIKTLLPEWVQGGGRRALKRFYREAKATSRVRHPNVVTLFDFGVDEATGMPFLAMEYVEGQNLAQRLESAGALDERAACAVLSQVAKALMAANEEGIIHRDLKPENILVTSYSGLPDHVKVLDFGIAKIVRRGAAGARRLTQTGTTLGTPWYMSPEQFMGDRTDLRSDLYALGCILYEVLTGNPPYHSDIPSEDASRDTDEEPTSYAVRLAILHCTRPSPRLPARLRGGAEPTGELRELLDLLLRKAPSERPSAAGKVDGVFTALAAGDLDGARELLSHARATTEPAAAPEPTQGRARTRPLGTAPAVMRVLPDRDTKANDAPEVGNDALKRPHHTSLDTSEAVAAAGLQNPVRRSTWLAAAAAVVLLLSAGVGAALWSALPSGEADPELRATKHTITPAVVEVAHAAAEPGETATKADPTEKRTSPDARTARARRQQKRASKARRAKRSAKKAEETRRRGEAIAREVRAAQLAASGGAAKAKASKPRNDALAGLRNAAAEPLPEKPDRDDLQELIEAVSPQVSLCYAQQKPPMPPQSVRTRVTIHGPRGAVKSVQIVEPKLPKSVQTCIRSAVAARQVPPFERREYSFQASFVVR